MRFALINNTKVEAQPKLHGLCPCCSLPVIAKCGKQKIWHWAHSNNTACDSWWEPETEWHRTWKNYYPAEWQEVPLIDERTGEKHIADVRTTHKLIIEFQHSRITPKERISRETFYKNMLWVVDGTRLKRDYSRFRKGVANFRRTNKQGIFIVDFPDEVFPANWLESSVPIIFDFRSSALPNEPQDAIRDTLWGLLPKRVGGYAVVVCIKHEDFIQTTHSIAQLFPEKQVEQQQIPPQQQPQMQVRRREPTHYYDPRKGRFIQRRRF